MIEREEGAHTDAVPAQPPEASPEEIQGHPLYDEQGDKVGDVDQVWTDEDGSAAWAVVGSGLLGRKTLVPMEDAHVAGDGVVTPFPKQQIEDAPGVDPVVDEPITADEVTQLIEHYDLSIPATGPGIDPGTPEGLPATADQAGEPGTSSQRAALVTVIVSIAQFIVVLESLSVSVALPDIGADLQMTPAALTWVLQAYMLAYGGFLSVAGRLGDLLGHRRLLGGGLILFGVSSLGVGAAGDPGVLLAGRAGQGLGAALILPAAMALLVVGRDAGQKARALAVWSAVGGAGVVTGAVIGGVVTGSLGWRWLFFGNIVIVLLMLAGLRLLPDPRPDPSRQRLDLVGAGLFTTGVAAVLFALSGSEEHGALTALHVSAFSLGLLLLGGFMSWQRRAADPLVPGRVLEARARRAASLGAVALNGGFACILVYGSTQLQVVLRYGPIRAGLALLPLAVLAAFATEPAARLCRRYRRSRVAVAGLAAMAAGFLLLTAAPIGGGYATSFLPGSLLLGAGISIAYVPLTLLAVGGVADRDRGIASGVYNTFGQVGSAVVLAIVTAGATLASSSAGPDQTAELVRNAYLGITILLFLGAATTWFTAHRPRQVVIQAPAELLNPPSAKDSAQAPGPSG